MSSLPQSAHGVVRRRQVQAETGLSRSTLYRLCADGLFTQPVRLGHRIVGWPWSEVSQINQARIAGQDHAALRALVVALHGQRMQPRA